MTVKADTNNTVATQVGLIIVGNSGVGKSYLANIILGEDRFVHEIRPDAVTIATEMHIVPLPINV